MKNSGRSVTGGNDFRTARLKGACDFRVACNISGTSVGGGNEMRRSCSVPTTGARTCMCYSIAESSGAKRVCLGVIGPSSTSGGVGVSVEGLIKSMSNMARVRLTSGSECVRGSIRRPSGVVPGASRLSPGGLRRCAIPPCSMAILEVGATSWPVCECPVATSTRWIFTIIFLSTDSSMDRN